MTEHKEKYHVIGVMSGTSFDGLDLVLASFQKNTTWNFQIIDAVTLPYSAEEKQRLKKMETCSQRELEILDEWYGDLIGSHIRHFLSNNAYQPDCIASHGHTVFHAPQKKISFQAGSGKKIAKRTGITTISDFRQPDVLLNGQGAPLVPIGDLHLFQAYEFCLNIGGFANISQQSGELIRAWDICPANYVLNRFAQQLKLPYDRNGDIARSTPIDNHLLEQLNHLSYYQKTGPKSLSREWVEDHIFSMLPKNLSPQTVIATFTEHAATQIAQQIPINSCVLITGGGAYNSYLIERIQHHQPQAELVLPTTSIIEYKEALIFAFMGLLRIRNEVNVLSFVTGATHDHSAGKINQP